MRAGKRVAAPIVAAAWLLFGMVATACAESRVALVIGNGAYRSIAELANPPNDAKDVAAQLTALGFNVSFGVDLDQATMASRIAAFNKAAATADVSLFYYGGHGVQMAGRNYLIPVDAQLHSEDEIYQRTIHLDEVVKGLEQEKGLHLVFLDACRNSPIKDAAAAASAGLARIGNAAGFLFTFATQPDNVAYDGAGRNSPFAQALLGHIATAGEDISSMMIDVRKDVIAATGGSQIPWENSSLTRQFYFAPSSTTASSPETLMWQVVATDPTLLNLYLDRYPEGPHAKDVHELMATLGQQHVPERAVDPKAAAESNQKLEQTVWQLARGSHERRMLEYYLAKFPDGPNAPAAANLLASLPEPETGEASAGVKCSRAATHPRDATADDPGVDLPTLTRNAAQAIEACADAVKQHPEIAHYVALLARSKAANGDLDEAIALYRKAADSGDARALVSLGLLYEAGQKVPKDLPQAYSLYEKAATRGNADGAINLAVALLGGKGIQKDAARAEKLLRGASRDGSAIATYNLGVLAQDGVAGKPEEALEFFRQSATLGDPRGYVAAAIILDEGRGSPKDAAAAAEELLRGVAADAGEATSQLVTRSSSWSPDTVKAVKMRLKAAAYYSGPVDGKAGPELGPALKQWRLLGAPQSS